jgi:serine/threonine protein kinase
MYILWLGLPSLDRLDYIHHPVVYSAIMLKKSEASVSSSASLPFINRFPDGTDPLAVDLLTKMLKFHPGDRITVEQALAHPYLKDFHGKRTHKINMYPLYYIGLLILYLYLIKHSIQ